MLKTAQKPLCATTARALSTCLMIVQCQSLRGSRSQAVAMNVEKKDTLLIVAHSVQGMKNATIVMRLVIDSSSVHRSLEMILNPATHVAKLDI